MVPAYLSFSYSGVASRALHCPKTPVRSNRLVCSVSAEMLDRT